MPEQKVEKGAEQREEFNALEVHRSAETAITSQAETAKAMVQARYIVAMKRPRSYDQFRAELVKACKRSRFAQMAVFQKPQGGAKSCGRKECPFSGQEKCGWVCGPSIRFADEAVKIAGNVDVRQEVIFEDGEQRITQVSVTDLETNMTKSQTVCIKKAVERRFLKQGAEVLSQRQNSKGEPVYLIRATDDEMTNREASMCARARRNLELQIVPQDLIEECTDICWEVRQAEVNADPDAARKKVCDGFAAIGVMPRDLEVWLGHSLSNCSPAEIAALRNVWDGIQKGESTWAECVEVKAGQVAHPPREKGKVSMEDLKATAASQEQPKAASPTGNGPATPSASPKPASAPPVERDPGVDDELPFDMPEPSAPAATGCTPEAGVQGTFTPAGALVAENKSGPPPSYQRLSKAYDTNQALVDATLKEFGFGSLPDIDPAIVAGIPEQMEKLAKVAAKVGSKMRRRP